MADDKTLGDYLKMMKQAEEDSQKPTEDEYYSSEDYEGMEQDDDSYDLLIKDIGDMDSDSEEQEQELEESFDSTISDILYNEQVWSNPDVFLSDLRRYSNNLDEETLETFLPEDDYNCDSYLIVGATLADGIIVVAKCFDPEGNAHNMLFNIREQPEFVREIFE